MLCLSLKDGEQVLIGFWFFNRCKRVSGSSDTIATPHISYLANMSDTKDITKTLSLLINLSSSAGLKEKNTTLK